MHGVCAYGACTALAITATGKVHVKHQFIYRLLHRYGFHVCVHRASYCSSFVCFFCYVFGKRIQFGSKCCLVSRVQGWEGERREIHLFAQVLCIRCNHVVRLQQGNLGENLAVHWI